MVYSAICASTQNQWFTDYILYIVTFTFFVIDSLYDLKARKGHLTYKCFVQFVFQRRPPDNSFYVRTCNKNPKKTKWWYHGEH